MAGDFLTFGVEIVATALLASILIRLAIVAGVFLAEAVWDVSGKKDKFYKSKFPEKECQQQTDSRRPEIVR